MKYFKCIICSLIFLQGCSNKDIKHKQENSYKLTTSDRSINIQYDSKNDFNDSLYWSSFLKNCINVQENELKLHQTKVFQGIIEKRFGYYGSEYFVYGTEKNGPILIVNPEVFNRQVICKLKSSTNLKNHEVDSLNNRCLKIYHGKGGLRKVYPEN
jgi:hypothetical protein